MKLSTQKTLNGDEGELDVALLKAFMGMVEAWELENAPDEVQAAFGTAVRHLWRQGKRGRPRLKRESIPRIELLLDRALAFEVEGYIEIPCVTEGWGAIAGYRERGRTGRQVQLRAKPGLSPGKARAKPKVPASPSEIPSEIQGQNGTPPAPKILDPKRVRTSTAVRKKEALEERLLFDSQETSTTAIATRFRATAFPGFDRFWAAYPHRRDKPAALAMWQKLGCEEFVDLVVSKVELLKAEDSHWHRGFVKWPHRWLRAEGWDDDPVPEPVERLPSRHLSADERQLDVIRRTDIAIAKLMEGEDDRRRSQKDH